MRIDRIPDPAAVPLSPPDAYNLIGSAKLHGIDPTDTARLPAALRAAGFSEERRGLFTLDRFLWVSIDRRGVFVGTHLGRLQRWPDPNYFPVRGPVPSDSFKIIRHTIAVRPATARAELPALGFRAVTDTFFVHPDCSWVLLKDGVMYRGVGEAVVSAPPPAPRAEQLRAYASVPAKTWQWFREHTALGNTPLLDSSPQARATLARIGYQKSTKDGREVWTHPACGSWVAFAGGGVSLGWQKFDLGQLPFNDRRARA